MARPTKYDDAIVKVIVDGIRAGLTNKDAALVAGIDETTLIRWEKRYTNFANHLAQARAKRSADWLAHIRTAGAKDWRAYAELLDRCAPEYRKRVVIEADIRLLVHQSAERLGLDADEERALFDRIKDLLATSRLAGMTPERER
jgi:hypothetical protein